MTGIIMKKVGEKLAHREKIEKLEYLNGILNILGDEQYRPQKTDAILNPLSEFRTVAEKRLAYNRALGNHARAYIDADNFIELGAKGAKFNDVEYIGGLWRIQRPFPYTITRVRDRDFIIREKLPRQEHTKFDFFKAYRVCNNCYGKYIFENGNDYDCIVAKYMTSRGTYWAYGKTIADARAFLAIKVYDEYQDVIEDEIQRNRARVK